MNHFKSLIIVSISLLVFFSACSEKDDFEPYLKGNIIGYAFCFDEYGRALEDYSGIEVVTEPGRKYSAVTDEYGRFVLKNVINGTYDLSFEKEGFGTMKMISVKHLGGNPTVVSGYGSSVPFLYEKSTTQINNIVYSNDTLIVDLSFSGDYEPYYTYVQLFLSSAADFDQQTAEASKSMELRPEGGKYKTNLGELYDNVSEDLPFTHGETVYCKAMIFSMIDFANLPQGRWISGINSYYDFETHTSVHPNISNETYDFQFTMP